MNFMCLGLNPFGCAFEESLLCLPSTRLTMAYHSQPQASGSAARNGPSYSVLLSNMPVDIIEQDLTVSHVTGHIG